jgi:hypothetical protein
MIMMDIDASSDAKTMASYLADLDLDDDGPSARADAKTSAGSDDEEDDLLALMDSAK